MIHIHSSSSELPCAPELCLLSSARTKANGVYPEVFILRKHLDRSDHLEVLLRIRYGLSEDSVVLLHVIRSVLIANRFIIRSWNRFREF